MTRRRLWGARLAALSAVFGGAVYLIWRAEQVAVLGAPAYVFFVAELVNYLALVAAVVLFWSPSERLPPPPPSDDLTVDVLIPVCGEDVEMVEATLRAALAIDFPHRTIVLNDGRLAGCDNWREVMLLCDEYGVAHFARTRGPRGKAGNLNAALDRTSADLIVVLDADHLARPELADMMLGYFRDPDMAFVTSRQCFKLDGGDLLGHQEALFYSAIQPAKDRHNAAFSCGNGVAYRRSALHDLGGFSEWNLVEDLHTSYELHARGWKSAYVTIPVSVGTAPSTAAEMASQRLRWATDSLRMFFWDNPLRKRGLTLRQRLHYLHTTGWYLVAAAHLIFLISPVVSILLGVRLLVPGTETTYGVLLVLYLGPVALMLISHVGARAAIRTAQIQTYLAPVFALAVMRALATPPRRRGRTIRHAVTPKTGERQTSWITNVQHGMLALLLISIGVSIARPGLASWAVVLWACLLAASIATPGSMLGMPREATQSLRIAITAPALGAALLVGMTMSAAPSVNARDARSAGVYSSAIAGVPPVASASSATSPHGRSPASTGPSAPLSVPRQGLYLGVYSAAVAGPPKRPLSVARYAGAKMRILHRFQAWWGTDRFLGKEWLQAVAERNAVPMVTWEPWGTRSRPAPQEGIVWEIARGRYDLYVHRWARDARAFGKPMLIRFMHEMNGDWYPWSPSLRGNSPEAFKAAWRRVHDIFVEEGATNVGWVFSVDSLTEGTPTSRRTLDHYYPGEDYVDWVGLSGFNWAGVNGGVLTYDEVFRKTYEIVKGYGKPIVIAEMGTATAHPQTASSFIRDVLTSTPRRFPRVKALVWYDARHPQRDFTLRGGALAALREGADRMRLRPAINLRPRPGPPPRGISP